MTRLTPAEVAEQLTKYDRLILKTACRLARQYPDSDVEDIAQAIRLEWLKAAGRFDPRHGYVLPTAAHRWAEKNVRRAVCWADGRHGMHVPERDGYVPFPRVVPVARADRSDDAAAGAVLPDTREPAPVVDPDWWDVVLGGLDADERAVVELHYREGVGLRAIGERFGWHKSRAGWVLDAALAKLRATKPHLELDLAG